MRLNLKTIYQLNYELTEIIYRGNYFQCNKLVFNEKPNYLLAGIYPYISIQNSLMNHDLRIY
jgi:hypothetical protein